MCTSQFDEGKILPHLVPPQLIVLKNQPTNQYFLRQYLQQAKFGEVSYHFIPKSLHSRLLCNQFGKCSGRSSGFLIGLPCFCSRNIVLYLNMNDKDEEYGECRDEEAHYFPRVVNRGYDVLLFNNILNRSKQLTQPDHQSSQQIIY